MLRNFKKFLFFDEKEYELSDKNNNAAGIESMIEMTDYWKNFIGLIAFGNTLTEELNNKIKEDCPSTTIFAVKKFLIVLAGGNAFSFTADDIRILRTPPFSKILDDYHLHIPKKFLDAEKENQKSIIRNIFN